jgi:hypothetical protein
MNGQFLSQALHGPGTVATATFWNAGQLTVKQVDNDLYDIYRAFSQAPLNVEPLTSYKDCVTMLRALGANPENPIWH